jgi:hypothetical protein
MKLWILRQNYNEYDQPENNLAAVWTTKPDVYTISKTMCGVDDLTKLSQEDLIAVVSVLKGEEVRFLNADYKLEQIEEGKL